jgi:hypothetical protein
MYQPFHTYLTYVQNGFILIFYELQRKNWTLNVRQNFSASFLEILSAQFIDCFSHRLQSPLPQFVQPKVSVRSLQGDRMSVWKGCPKCSQTHLCITFTVKESTSKSWATSVIQKAAHSKQLSIRRKVAQSGHPGRLFLHCARNLILP